MYGYTPEYALRMPAVQFFTLLEKGEEMKRVELNYFYVNMCDIVHISNCDANGWYKPLRDNYLANTGYEIPRSPTIDPGDLINVIKGGF